MYETEDEPVDSVGTDSLLVIDDIDTENDIDEVKSIPTNTGVDSSFIGPLDPSLFKPIINLPPPKPFDPYYKTYLTQKGLGDILRYKTGVFALQHGAVGQPEMLTKSLMLPGAQAIYNGVPVFHQGIYFPFRSGADLNALMSDNVSEIEIAPLSYLDLFSEGQVISLNSTVWPSDNNPSSLTHARGSYDYERTTWRFSRKQGQSFGISFTAAFKQYIGYYQSGGDYDDFRISGTAVWRPSSNIELRYGFYQYKAKMGLIQFDRLLTPTRRTHNDLTHHTITALYQYSNSLFLIWDSYYQHNYNRVFDKTYDVSYRVRDGIIGTMVGAELTGERNKLSVKAGLQSQKLKDISSYEPTSASFGFLVNDSLAITEKQSFIASGRIKNNNKSDLDFSGTARYRIYNITLSGGFHGSQPDLYAMYYAPPALEFTNETYINSYTYYPDPDIEAKRTTFGAASIDLKILSDLSANLGVSYENVSNDLTPVTYAVDSVYFYSTQRNIDYDRLTLTADLSYGLTRFFTGSTGVTYFSYDPTEIFPGLEFSPSLLAYSRGQLLIPEVLRDIDISGAFQVRYYSERNYSGFIDDVFGLISYGDAIVVDGSLALRFSSFEFRISEDNIADFFVDNKYNLWGEYSMPPAVVWWQIIWNFDN